MKKIPLVFPNGTSKGERNGDFFPQQRNLRRVFLSQGLANYKFNINGEIIDWRIFARRYFNLVRGLAKSITTKKQPANEIIPICGTRNVIVKFYLFKVAR